MKLGSKCQFSEWIEIPKGRLDVGLKEGEGCFESAFQRNIGPGRRGSN